MTANKIIFSKVVNRHPCRGAKIETWVVFSGDFGKARDRVLPSCFPRLNMAKTLDVPRPT